MPCHQAMSLTFEFLHTCCKSLNKNFMGGNVLVLRVLHPCVVGFAHVTYVCVYMGC